MQRSFRRLFMSLIALAALGHDAAVGEIPWGFNFGDDENTVLGTFVSDGNQSDLDGTGILRHVVTRLNDVYLNGSIPMLEEPLDPAGPRSPTGEVIPQEIEWSRDRQEVESLPSGGLLSWFSNTQPIASELSLSLKGTEFGSEFINIGESGSFSVGPDISVSIVPIRRTLLGNDSHGVLYDIDVETGRATNPRPTEINGLAGIRFAPDGTLYGIQDELDPMTGGKLYTIDATSGAATFVGDLHLPNTFIEGDLDFHPQTGELYGLQDFFLSADGRTSRTSVFTIDTDNGRATVFGVAQSGGGDFVDLSATAFDTVGTWYATGVDIDRGVVVGTDLLTLSTITGEILTSVPLEFGPSEPLLAGAVGGMAFDPFTSRLYFADGLSNGTDSLHLIDPATAEVVSIGPTGLDDGLSGLAFPPATLFGAMYPPTVVPEPATWIMLLIGMATMLAVRRTAVSKLIWA
jgi:hypothetical protein